MDAINFAYWLNGFAELHGGAPPTKAQWKAIREHLELVFNKVKPPVGLPQPLKDWTPAQQIPQIYPQQTPWWLRQAQCATGSASQSIC